VPRASRSRFEGAAKRTSARAIRRGRGRVPAIVQPDGWRVLPWFMRMLSPVRFSAPTPRISLRSARPRRRRKETDVDLPPQANGIRQGPMLVSSARRRRSHPPLGASHARAAVRTTGERAEEPRQAKLELVRLSVKNGSLVTRRIAEEVRLRHPRRTVRPS